MTTGLLTAVVAGIACATGLVGVAACVIGAGTGDGRRRFGRAEVDAGASNPGEFGRIPSYPSQVQSAGVLGGGFGGSWPTKRLLVPLLLGGVAGLVTRWPVVGLLTAIAAALVPGLVRDLSQRSSARQIEAVAVWTELLRDTLAASAGLSQGIISTAPLAPEPLVGPLQQLASALHGGVSIADALRSFADTMADPGVDLVVSALLLAASARAQRLTELLGALADAIREEAALQLRIDASRASARSGIRTVVVFSAVFAVGLAVLAHSYLAPFGTTSGELVLLAVGGSYIAGLLLMVRLTKAPAAFRLLAPVGATP